ncbi:MAG: hypothetical protein NXI23_21540 [Bacteroidetes bacterium]|jgi:hypothetical protein|nr:hypothetical protein [Bacteroidota bacterium]
MEKTGKIITFIIVCLVIIVGLTVIKESGGGGVMWIGALLIPIIYGSLFNKKEEEKTSDSKDITLNKD